MPKRDLYHDVVVAALEREGWTITDDPLRLPFGRRNLYLDLGAENVVGAMRDNQRIAVEIKSFTGPSDMNDLEKALGQYILYLDVLAEVDPERVLYLAIPRPAYDSVFSDPLGQLVIKRRELRLIVFGEIKKEPLEWIL